jgi:hypothetical protein
MLIQGGSCLENAIALLAPVVCFWIDNEPPPPELPWSEQVLADIYAQWVMLLLNLVYLLYVCVVVRTAWSMGWNLYTVVSSVLNPIRMVVHVPCAAAA